MKEDAAAERAPICPACGYDLRGTPLGRCPECGSPFETIRVFGDADALIKARWQALQNGTYASLLCALSVPLIYLAPFPPFCFLWVVPPVLLVYLVTTVARAALWRWSSHGKRILAAATPGLRSDFVRAFQHVMFAFALAMLVCAAIGVSFVR